MSKRPLWFLVDDDPDDHDIFLMALEDLDKEIECICCLNGPDALEKLKHSEFLPDVIFLDLNMPVMSGKECLVAIKNTLYLKHIPVVIYSTSSDQRDKEETLKLGAAYFLTKPSSISLLTEELKSIFVNNSR